MPRVVFVTGAARGLGRALGQWFLERGDLVVALDCSRAVTQDWSSAADASVLPIVGDVTNEDDIVRATREAVERFGGIDALINNAGLADPYHVPVERLARADFERWIDVNLVGPFLVTKHAVPALRRRRGSIVNIASTRAHACEANTEAYSASKGGLLALTRALAVSLGPEIRVNAVTPGWIDTTSPGSLTLRPEDHAQHTVGRVGQPNDVAAAAAFLISPEAGFITGQELIVDGGMSRRMLYIP